MKKGKNCNNVWRAGKVAMKMCGNGMRRRLAMVPLCLSLMIGWAACGSGASNDAYYNSTMATSPSYGEVTEMDGGYLTGGIYDEGYVYTDSTGSYKSEEMPESAATTAESGIAQLDSRKLIKTVDMDVETKEYDMVMSKLEQQINSLGGYIENSDTYNGSTYYGRHNERYASMTIRIPKQNLNSFLETVSGICNVVRRSDNVEDVTLSYVDMESRRDTLKIEQERLLALLEKANDLESIIVLEERLSEVRYQLESMESQLRTLDNQVDYSTVYLYISEVKELTPVAEQTALERIAEGFKDSLEDIGEGAVDFAVWFVINIPYFIVWGIIFVILGIIIHLLGKRSRRLRAEKAAKASVTGAISTSTSEKK